MAKKVKGKGEGVKGAGGKGDEIYHFSLFLISHFSFGYSRFAKANTVAGAIANDTGLYSGS